ncbi:hypothetical protein BP5796_04862 [Coleophoma crateriformis]|uniref:Rhodopsin domain-containing protein n=1 Tax=Coleophoma crateriformis TaxID=565419 RepID=A0A3D8SB45_9HELO|nr:hypothetical protein BP5796_04862 [Coleophoma crateriformis]
MYSYRSTQVLVVSTLFLTVAAVVVGLRFYVRGRIVRKFGIEDFFVGLTLRKLSSICQTVTVYDQVYFGLGRHTSTITQKEGISQLKILYISIIFYGIGLTTVKWSILSQYQRLFVRKEDKIKAWILVGIVTVFGLFIVLSSVLTCIPAAKFWDDTIPGYCQNKRPLWFVHAAFNVCTDFAIMILPMPVLWRLQMPKRQKVTLMCIFGLGGVVCIISAIRVWTIDVATTTKDPSFDMTTAAILSSVEVNVAIICSSLPTTRPLAGRLFPSLWGSSSGSRTRSNLFHSSTGHQSGIEKKRGAMELKSLSSRNDGHFIRIETQTKGGIDLELGNQANKAEGNATHNIVKTTKIEQHVECRSGFDSESERSLIIQFPGKQ